MTANILYIEDNEQNFYLVSFLLAHMGHRVSWARDGQAGIEAAVRDRPDLILLDIQLPVMDGYEVARALRSRADLASVSIVAVTSYAMPGDRAKALAAGCNGYIEKPIDPDTFGAEIAAVLAAVAASGTSE